MVCNRDTPFDELQWVIQVRRILEEEVEDDDTIPVSISTVPKPLLSGNAEVYTPQLIAIGPYHHCREELHEMERYKLSAAKRAQKNFPNLKLNHIVDIFTKLDYPIRAHYHRYIDMNEETLAWMMAIDASFLIEFLQIYAVDDNKSFRRIPSRLSHVVDFIGRKLTHNMILRDIVMLENQIPLFLLRKILELRCTSSKIGDQVLSSMVVGFLNEISPFKMMSSTPCMDVTQYSHLLELLYHSIVPECKEDGEILENNNDHSEQSQRISSRIKWLIDAIGNFILGRCKALALIIIKLLVKIPWGIMSNLPVFAIFKQPVEHLFSQMDQNPNSGSNSSPNIISQPLVEEIMIPSVSELASAGTRFLPTTGDLSTIEFNPKTATLHLPTISLDVNSEVVLRNLVAYETSITSGPLFITRYIEFMNGIIDTEEDVKLLRDCRIVLNRMKSDHEVAHLWNGMSRSVRLTRVRNLDGVIEDVNKYYNTRWRVKIKRFVKSYVLGSWQLLAFIVTLMLFLMISLQVFCMLFGCTPLLYLRRTRPRALLIWA